MCVTVGLLFYEFSFQVERSFDAPLMESLIIGLLLIHLGNCNESNLNDGSNEGEHIDNTERGIRVVTSCSSGYFPRLRNFIGSVHYWEPDLNVTLFC